jgi:hypothetical protein
MAPVLAEFSFHRIILLTESVQRHLRGTVDVDVGGLVLWSLHGVLLATGLVERCSHIFVRVTG